MFNLRSFNDQILLRIAFAYLTFRNDPVLDLCITTLLIFSCFTFQAARNASEVRQDNLLADFDEIPDPKRYVKHKSCYATYTNLRDVNP